MITYPFGWQRLFEILVISDFPWFWGKKATSTLFAADSSTEGLWGGFASSAKTENKNNTTL
ncbi:hypothetical protein AA0614_1400 [Komagataeibacter saccharivorans NRIC 0614]|nr:hypothetical protein AA0614_1400 [Komagataeibacter saccharivorans NRIC 0614]